MSQKSPVEKYWRSVLCRDVGEECCREVWGKSVVEKWWGKSVVEKCWGRVFERSVGEKCFSS